MNFASRLLPLSLAANLALAVLVIARSPAGASNRAMRHLPPAEPRWSEAFLAPVAASEVAPAAAVFDAATPGALTEGLRATGFPPAMIRAAVATRFGPQTAAAEPDDDPIRTAARRRMLVPLDLSPEDAEALENASPVELADPAGLTLQEDRRLPR